MSNRLPTRQQNALRVLLDKPLFSLDEVSQLDYANLIRAPGIGHKGIAIIRDWLIAHGHTQLSWPAPETPVRERQTAKKLEQAIALLNKHGYEVHRAETPGPVGQRPT